MKRTLFFMLAACLLALPLTAKTKTLSEKDMGAEAKQQEPDYR